MKKFFYLFLCTAVLCSCNKVVSNVDEHGDTDGQNFEQLLMAVDELNASYGVAETKGAGGAVLTSFADVGGKALGSWLGSKLGAGLGVVTANPVVGVVGYVAGRKFGGVAGAAAASYVAAHFLGGCIAVLPPFDPSNPDSQTICLLDDPSYGETHNFLLNLLQQNGKTYISSDGSISIEDVYDDLVALENEYGIEDPLSDNGTIRSIMISFCADVANAAQISMQQNESAEIHMGRIANLLLDRGLSDQEVNVFVQLSERLIGCASLLEEEVARQYEEDFEDLVMESNLTDQQKEETIQVGSVAIMSTIYWQN